MQKKHFIVLLILINTALSYVQDANYKTIQSITYYQEEIRKENAYLSERCVLEIFYPQHIS